MDAPQDAGCDKAKMLSFINIGIAVMHTGISIYVQNAIVNRIKKMHEEDGIDTGELRADDIMKATKHIIAYDFLFCFYVFALPASTFYNCYRLADLDRSACSQGYGPAWACSICMIMFGFATMCYLPCMYCGTCCAAGTKKVTKKAKGKGTKPAGDV